MSRAAKCDERDPKQLLELALYQQSLHSATAAFAAHPQSLLPALVPSPLQLLQGRAAIVL